VIIHCFAIAAAVADGPAMVWVKMTVSLAEEQFVTLLLIVSLGAV
jgi:hypothetical protein